MTTKQFFKDEVIVTDKKKRRRQLQSQRRQVFGNDVVPTIPLVFVLLLLSGSHLPKNDAFPLVPIQQSDWSIKPSTIKSAGKSQGLTNDLFRRRKRQFQFHGESSFVLSFSSRSLDGRSEKSEKAKITDKGKRDSKEPTPSGIDEPEESSPATVAEAKVLRAKAEELRAEARVMELELKQRASKRQREKDGITDELIATLFLPLQYQDPQLTANTAGAESGTEPSEAATTTAAAATMAIPDARVVADRLRQGKYTRQQIISVVDRLYQQHHKVNEQEGAVDFMNTTESQGTEKEEEQHQKQQEPEKGVGVLPNTKGRYSNYFQVLVLAASLLDESIVANTKTAFEDATKTTKSAATTQTESTSLEPTSSAPSVPSLKPSLSSFNISSSPLASPISFVMSGHIGKAIQSRIGELRQMKQVELNRRIAAETNRIASMSASSSGWSSEYSTSTSNGTSTSIAGEFSGQTPSFIPMWIPSAYIPYILSLDKSSESSPSESTTTTSTATNATAPLVPFAIIRNSSLDSTELEILKNKVLLGSRFYMTSFEFAPGAALFRGNMRMSLGNVPTVVPSLENGQNKTAQRQINNNTAMVFADIQERLETAGLGDKVQLFVLPDPEGMLAESARRSSMRRPHIEAAAKPEEAPVILALPKKLTPDESKLKKGWIRKIGKRLSYPIAALSMFFYSLKAFALNPHFFERLVIRRDATVLYSCIPLVLGFLAVQLIHEVAHYLVAKRKNIKIGFPVPVSTPFYSNLPFFGCITPLRSFPPNRAALVDFALSGPMASLAVSLCMVFGGVLLTSRASAGQIARFPFLSVHTMKSNFLLGSILSWLLPKTMMLPLAQPIPMHPLFVIGRFGMISSALNLLPIFRLDGGRACLAALGQRQGAVISAFTILWIVSHFFMSSSTLLVWTLLVALFQMRVEIPCRDECTEVGGKREWLWFISFMLSVSILIPFPQHGSFL